VLVALALLLQSLVLPSLAPVVAVVAHLFRVRLLVLVVLVAVVGAERIRVLHQQPVQRILEAVVGVAVTERQLMALTVVRV
jgi:hypothetical protein